MPNLLNRSNHKEFESNSALQIRIQKERRAEKAGKSSTSQKGAKTSHHCAKISHCAKMLILVFSFALLTPVRHLFFIFPIFPFMYHEYLGYYCLFAYLSTI